MKLIGSTASPYVRRVRNLLSQLEADFEFDQIIVFSDEGQNEILKHSKSRRVPILIDGDKSVWDSLLICKYLLNKYNKTSLSIEEEQDLILINEANDSAITLYQMKYFSLDEKWENTFSKNNLKRLVGILHDFNERPSKETYELDLKNNFLYCLLNWLNYREVYDWSEFKNLKHFYEALSSQEIIQQTAP